MKKILALILVSVLSMSFVACSKSEPENKEEENTDPSEAAKETEATAGCIAVPEIYMKEIVKRVESQCVLIIDEMENIMMY